MATRLNQNDGFNRTGNDDAPLGELLKRFGQDGASLVKQEIALAKLEMRESVKGYMADAAKIGVAAGVGLLGSLALLAFMIIGLGDLLNNYWLSALIVAVAFLAIASMLFKGATAHMKSNSMAPRQTVATIKDDQRWAKNEVQDFKRKLKA
ncbi:MAG TPA: phage holin family protein [Longimicrobiales bacterium]|nr:phage holin family protein [Longimicrobiales bacterium]